VGTSFGLALFFSFFVNPITAWLISINVIAIITFRYDKLIAGSKRTRVPEAILLLLEAIGGTLGAGIAMWILRPRHKSESHDFLLRYYAIIAMQIIGLVLLFYFFVW
jgi:uncharacterized membrane protein YsdA (DUF1294 family)